ncbi:MAG TPA: hypothetical protein VLT36_14620, partial [Candidatus Dormibacteraeota bacterium]|nr:hypothetical protein [Candidatus Dormibacteraeota bacterium]
MLKLVRGSALLLLFAGAFRSGALALDVEFPKYDSGCGVLIARAGEALEIKWRGSHERNCAATLSLRPGEPLLKALGVSGKVLASEVTPVFDITTGARVQRPGVKYIFFDKPATGTNGPVRHFTAALDLKSVRVESAGARATVSLNRLRAGPFSGDLNLHFYAGSSLIQIEAAMRQEQKGVAYIYDAVVEGRFEKIAWKNPNDEFVREIPSGMPRPVAVRYRTIMAESEKGTVAVFPPPHAFFFPRDYSINFKFAQVGEGRFGLRQDPAGGQGHEGAYIPWFDAPAGKVQRMSLFVYLSPETPEQTLTEIEGYTHQDKFKRLDGFVTFAGHMHSALTVHEHASAPRAATFKKVFKGMNVQAFQLAEFHGDGHPKDTGTLRLEELQGMFGLCRKYSDPQFLLLPSEEANAYFPGHTVLLFPKPVFLTLAPTKGKPFSEAVPPY